MRDISDNQLLGAWRDSKCNPSATELWNRYNRLGSSVARSILHSHIGNADDVFDVNNDSFLDSLHKFDAQRYAGPQDTAFKNYYLRLVKNRAISMWRKRKNMPKMEPFEDEGEVLSNNLYQNLLVQNEMLMLRQFVKQQYLNSDSSLLEDWLESKRIGVRPQWNEFATTHPVTINRQLVFDPGEVVAINEVKTFPLLIKTMDLCPEITVELQICPNSDETLNRQRANRALARTEKLIKKRFQSNTSGNRKSRLSVTMAQQPQGNDITLVITRGAYRCPNALRMRLNAIINNYRKKFHND
ncbi:MAG: sigma-70 family RNA polymerase sigma factor [Algicola sp.]|nr:sigma-70 family RNA polymerase sigma factor [Algicola sp.]